MNPLIQFTKRTLLFVTAFALTCFALAPDVRAGCQQGCGALNITCPIDDAIITNTTGFNNTATGFAALFSNTIGTNNTANGASALHSNTFGQDNTATGSAALFSNTGFHNTANGSSALFSNT